MHKSVPMPRLFALALVVLCGCPAGGGRTPETTVASFARALREDRYEDAYDMMSRSYRRRVPFAEFERHLRANPDETHEAAEALDETDGEAEQTAVLLYADGEALNLVYESGSWHIADNIVDFYDQSTPRAALRSFVRAMERRRYDVVMRFVPNADREGMSVERMEEAWSGEGREEVERLVANLSAHLDAPIEQVGDRATMPYGEQYVVRFVREDDLWKIEDPD